MIRVLRGLAAVAVAVAIGIPAGAATASAAPLDLTCAGTVTTTFSPGLTLVPTEQTVTANEIDAPCTSPTVPEIGSGTSVATVHQVLACVDLLEPGSAARTFTWNTGQTTVFTYNRNVSQVGGNTVVTLTGTITSGLFTGDTAVETITGATLDTLKCLTPPGITSRTGVTVLTITST